MEETLERIYTIPLRKVKWSSRNGQADRAIRAIRQYLVKHMKADEVWIDAAVNHHIWSRGKFKIPSKVRIRARLFDDGVCEVSLPEEETTTGESMREQMAEARERKLEEAHKGELEALERAEAEGAATPSGLTTPVPPEEDEAVEDEEPEDEAIKEAADEEETPEAAEPKQEAARDKPETSKTEETSAEKQKPEAPKPKEEPAEKKTEEQAAETSEDDTTDEAAADGEPDDETEAKD